MTGKNEVYSKIYLCVRKRYLYILRLKYRSLYTQFLDINGLPFMAYSIV